MQTLPFIIKKHAVGYFFIAGVGFGGIALIWAFIYCMWQTGDLTELTYWMMSIASVIILLITLVQLYVYSLSYIELTETGTKVKNWRTLFVSQDAEAGWSRVQDVSWTTGSIWSLLFNYGTLEIQTAGTTQRLSMTMVPDAEYWQAVISAYADDAADFSTATP